MVVLDKIKASTLMETLVATVLIVIVFMISGLVLNNVFSATVRNNTKSVETHIKELRYLETHGKLPSPYFEESGNWKISMEKIMLDGQMLLEFHAANSETNKTITKLYLETEN